MSNLDSTLRAYLLEGGVTCIGKVTLLPILTLIFSASCLVSGSRNTSRHFRPVSQYTAFGRGVAALKLKVRSHSTEKLKQVRVLRVEEHQLRKCILHLPFCLFTYLATMQLPQEGSPRDPGVVRLHVNTSYILTQPRWVTLTPCKQALRDIIIC